MVYHHISVDMKCRALHLLAEGWKLWIITDSLGHGQVEPGSVNRGQRRLLTQDVIADIQEVLLETPDLYPDEIAEWFLLTAHHNNLHDLGLSRKLIQRTAAEREHELRATWTLQVCSWVSSGSSWVSPVFGSISSSCLLVPARRPRILILSEGNCAFAVFMA